MSLRRGPRLTLLGGGSKFDPAALAYFAVAGITNTNEKRAVNTLIVSLKSGGVWSKLDRLYLCSPTSSTAAKVCAKSLTSLTVATGAPTFAVTGWAFNGSSAFDTGFKPSSSSIAGVNNLHVSAYVPNYQVLASDSYLISSEDAGRSSLNEVYLSQSPTKYSYLSNLGPSSLVSGSTIGLNPQGLIVCSRTSSTSNSIYQNGSVLSFSSSANTTTLPSQKNYQLGARFNGTTTDAFFTGTLSFWSIGSGLSQANVTAFDTAVQAYQTALSRHWVPRNLIQVGPFQSQAAVPVINCSNTTDGLSTGSEGSPQCYQNVTITSTNRVSYSSYVWCDVFTASSGTIDGTGQDGFPGFIGVGGGQGGDGYSGGGGGGYATDTGSGASFESGGSGGSSASGGSQGGWDNQSGAPGNGGNGVNTTPSYSVGSIASGGNGGDVLGGADGAGGGGGGGGGGFVVVTTILDASGTMNINCAGGAGAAGAGSGNSGTNGNDGFTWIAAKKKIGSGMSFPSNYQLLEINADGSLGASHSSGDTWDNT